MITIIIYAGARYAESSPKQHCINFTKIYYCCGLDARTIDVSTSTVGEQVEGLLCARRREGRGTSITFIIYYYNRYNRTIRFMTLFTIISPPP